MNTRYLNNLKVIQGMIKIKKNLKDINVSYSKLHKITKFYKIF